MMTPRTALHVCAGFLITGITEEKYQSPAGPGPAARPLAASGCGPALHEWFPHAGWLSSTGASAACRVK